MPHEKLDPHVVLYMSGKEIGAPEGSHCGKCMMFWGDEGSFGKCTVVKGSIDGPQGVCGLYVRGKHTGPDMAGKMDPETPGYGKVGPTHCGSCTFYGGDETEGPCQVVKGTVEFEGCCNHWQKARDREWKI